MSLRNRIVTALVGLVTLVVSSCGAPAEEESAAESSTSTSTTSETSTPSTEIIGEPRTGRRTLRVDGERRNYWVTAPPAAVHGESVPLIFVFHGMGEYASSIREYSNFDNANAVVVYPNGIDKAWAPAPYAETTGQEDLEFVDEIRADIESRYNINSAKVFAAGLSNGGGFAAYLGCQRPYEFTAIATVSAAYYWRVADGCSVIPMKHIDIHGTADEVIEYEGGERHETEYHSVPEMLSDAARRNHCSDEVVLSRAGNNAVRSTYQDCDAPLEHIRVGSGGHVWPGSDNDDSDAQEGIATREILDFWGVTYRGG